jgi:hypothetical protein
MRKPFSINLTGLPLLFLTLSALTLIARLGLYRLKIPAYISVVAVVLFAPAMLRDYGIIEQPGHFDLRAVHLRWAAPLAQAHPAHPGTRMFPDCPTCWLSDDRPWGWP